MPTANSASDVAATLRGVLEALQSLPSYARDARLKKEEQRLAEIWLYLNALPTANSTPCIAPSHQEPIELRVWPKHIELISRLNHLLMKHDRIQPAVLIRVSASYFLFLTGFQSEEGTHQIYRIMLVPEANLKMVVHHPRYGPKPQERLS